MKRLFLPLLGTKPARQAKSRRPRFEALEDRNFLAGDLVEAETLLPGGLPALHSNPGASKTLYLNFTGNTIQESYESDVGNLQGLVTYAFDLDGQGGDFSLFEQQAIREITRIVAEDFAPFDIDVTTDYVGTLDDGEELQVAIGGTNIKLLPEYRRVGYSPLPLGGFNNEAPNTVLVDLTSLAQLPLEMHSAIIGNTASHEAGHAFGLSHHKDLSVANTSSEEHNYWNGTDVWTPIMGHSAHTDRATWSHATVGGTEPEPELQDGFEILTTVLGLRSDDHGDNSGLATPLTDVDPGVKMEGSGRIGTLDDVDFFSFRGSYSGDYKVFVNVPGYGNLDARLAVYTDAGEVVDDGEMLDAKATVSLQADTDYFFSVTSHGTYGDLGHYDIVVLWVVREIGLMPEVPELPAIPVPDPYDPTEWRDPSEVYDPATNIWINPEFVFDPAIQELLEPIAEQIYDPAVEVWGNLDDVYNPLLELAVTEYIPGEPIYELTEYIPTEPLAWNALVVEPVAQPSPIITAVLADAVFSNISAVKSMRRFWF